MVKFRVTILNIAVIQLTVLKIGHPLDPDKPVALRT
jgi:hypothetical protein